MICGHKNDYFITQMKLRELREQRTRLLRVYESLRRHHDQASHWQYRNNAWSSFYQSLIYEIAASEPVMNQVMRHW